MVWDLDVHCSRNYHSSHNTFSKVQTQGSKDFSCPKKPKFKDSKSALLYDNTAELSKKNNRKNKKKKFRSQKWKYTRKRKE